MSPRVAEKGGFEHSGRPLRVVAIDPGVTTGVVWCTVDAWKLRDEGPAAALKGGQYSVGEYVAESGDWQQEQYVTNTLRTLVVAQNPLYVVFEDFIMAPSRVGGRDVVAPVRMTALLMGALACSGKAGVGQSSWKGGFAFISPSSAKSVCTNDRLHRWGLWHVGSDHIVDAMRVLVTWMRGYAEGMAKRSVS